MTATQWETMGASPEMAKALADSDDCIVRAEALLMRGWSLRMAEKLDAEMMDCACKWAHEPEKIGGCVCGCHDRRTGDQTD